VARRSPAAAGHEPAHDDRRRRRDPHRGVVRGRDGVVPVRLLAGARVLEHRAGAARDRQAARPRPADRAAGDRGRGTGGRSGPRPGRLAHRGAAGGAPAARRAGRRRAIHGEPGADHRREPADRQGAGGRGLRRVDQRVGGDRDRDHRGGRGDDARQDPPAGRGGAGAALAVRALGRSGSPRSTRRWSSAWPSPSASCRRSSPAAAGASGATAPSCFWSSAALARSSSRRR
jgi:hypothetical protein